jgi:hypothetical protein
VREIERATLSHPYTLHFGCYHSLRFWHIRDGRQNFVHQYALQCIYHEVRCSSVLSRASPSPNHKCTTTANVLHARLTSHPSKHTHPPSTVFHNQKSVCKHAGIEGVVEVVALVVGHVSKISISSRPVQLVRGGSYMCPLVHLQAEALLFTLLDLIIPRVYS